MCWDFFFAFILIYSPPCLSFHLLFLFPFILSSPSLPSFSSSSFASSPTL
eukprot:m.18575 g.18575  ORF g.18575 m.18575 type:complete len:50 (+) comp11967_c0_seq1:136-285(+)